MKNRRPQQAFRKQNRGTNDGVGVVRSGLRVSLGVHAIKEAIKVRPAEIVRIIIRLNWESSKELSDIVREARKHRIIIDERNAEIIDRIGGHNQGIACEIKGRPVLDLESLGKGQKSIVLVLDGVEDPHNLGAILRTGWLMGFRGHALPSVTVTITVYELRFVNRQ